MINSKALEWRACASRRLMKTPGLARRKPETHWKERPCSADRPEIRNRDQLWSGARLEPAVSQRFKVSWGYSSPSSGWVNLSETMSPRGRQNSKRQLLSERSQETAMRVGIGPAGAAEAILWAREVPEQPGKRWGKGTAQGHGYSKLRKEETPQLLSENRFPS